ncbi:plasmid recombination protein [Lacimicrobium sp. SS2-24]|uniref:plasmid recombination protein n=1 Tax=Lacimicrobium sp. SS2-24 TaxID=2005569 RepID=UPI000B4B43E9|nr:plasmid recombination protein [Lacimicrobium sp. SS2-24]
MTYQFIRIEAYSLNKTKERPDAVGVIREARREETHSKHISGCFKTRRILGKDLNIVEDEIRQFEYKKINGKAVRKDARVLIGGIASYPIAFTDSEYDRAQMLRWVIATTKFLKDKFGNNLKSVVLHEDETYPHLHFYCYDTEKTSVADIHPGNIAEKNCRSKSKKGKLEAYKQGLSSFQDDFYKTVSLKFDMERKKDGVSVRLNKEAKKAFDQLCSQLKAATEKLSQAISQCKNQKKTIKKQEELIAQLKHESYRKNLEIDRLTVAVDNMYSKAYKAAKDDISRKIKLKKIKDAPLAETDTSFEVAF